MKSRVHRRQVLCGSGAAASLWLSARPERVRASTSPQLVRDPDRIVDLRRGFSYRVLSRAGEAMSDGYRVPAKPDGMGLFHGHDGSLILMRNHEVPGVRAWGPYRDGQLPPPESYDPDAHGGVTRVVLDPRTFAVRRSNLVLTGTHWNCAGGVSPWGWLSCEEIFSERHGYVFLCPHTAERVSPARPIRGYGRFRHEAAAVDPRTHVAYLSEDREDAAFYRFLPRRPDKPFEGKLQALMITGQPRFDTNGMSTGDTLPVSWVDVDDPDPREDNVRLQAQARGAARFVRTEGMWLHGASLYVCATAGGPIGRGQIFRLDSAEPASLTLIAHSEDARALDMPDNITVSPSGKLYVAEDGLEGNCLRQITPEGSTIEVARAVVSTSEFAGPCFAPDGKTLFVNIQANGLTLAITGPFDEITNQAQPKAAGANHPEGILGLGAGAAILALAALSRRKQNAIGS